MMCIICSLALDIKITTRYVMRTSQGRMQKIFWRVQWNEALKVPILRRRSWG